MTETYKKIIVIGNSGSGKSTLAQKIGETLSLPVHHMDLHFWGENWQHPDDEEWRDKVLNFLSEEKWVIEGGINNLEKRVEAADLIVYLKFPTWFCLWRVLSRYVKFMIDRKPFLPLGCKNRMDWDFLEYIFTFNYKRRVMIEAALAAYEGRRKITILQSTADVKDFEETFLKNLAYRRHSLASQFAPHS